MKKNRQNNRIIYKNNDAINRETNTTKSIIGSCPDIHDDFDRD